MPSEYTRGPWSAEHQHGGPPSALLCHVAEAAVGDPAWRTIRVVVDMLRPVPLSPLSIETSTVHEGRRVARRVSTLHDEGGRVLSRATLLQMREQSPAAFATHATTRPPAPEDAAPMTLPHTADLPGYQDLVDLRCGSGTWLETPVLAWFRMHGALVEGREPSGLERVVLAADAASGVGASLDWHTTSFVNAELTVHLVRPPVDAWVGMETRTDTVSSGIGLCSAAVVDRRGLIGRVAESLVLTALLCCLMVMPACSSGGSPGPSSPVPAARAPVPTPAPELKPLSIPSPAVVAATPASAVKTEVIAGRDVSWAAPAGARATVVLFHGTGGSAANWLERPEAMRFGKLALDHGYAIVAPSSGDREKGVWLSGWPDNVDFQMVVDVLADLRSRGAIPASGPVYGVGMSNGGSFVSVVGTRLGFDAVAIHCATGAVKGWTGEMATPEVFYVYSEHDSIVPAEAVAAAAQVMRERGVRVREHRVTPTALNGEHLRRVIGIESAGHARIVRLRLKEAGLIDEADMVTRVPSQIEVASAIADMGNRVMIKGVWEELRLAWGEHAFTSDQALQTFAFFDEVTARR